MVTLSVNVNGDPVCGGGGTFTTGVWVGGPSIELEEISLTNFVIVNMIGANGTDIYEQGITSTTWEEVFSDGKDYVGFSGDDFSGLGEGQGCDWFARIKVTATNSCGTTEVFARIQPSTDTCDATYLRFSQNPMREGSLNNKITVYTGVNRLPNQEYTITIHTQYANLVYSKTQKETEFNISHLKKGFYIARLRTIQGSIISEKFIIEE